MRKTSCGPLYYEGLAEATNMDPKLVPVYAAGFVNGQAEKVYLGACRAAMFRPSPEWQAMVADCIEKAAVRYGLRHMFFNEELWLLRDGAAQDKLCQLSNAVENSPQWHLIRAALTGVPIEEVDLRFHERKGFGEPCDIA